MSVGSIEELERRIEDTRQELERTLHALRLELSPRHQLERAWHFAKQRTGDSLRAGARWAIANPAPALLAAVVMTGALCVVVEKLRQRAQ